MSESREDCLWWQGSDPDCLQANIMQGRHTTDIAIVGGGFTGLWAAIHAKLLAPDTDVTLLEARAFGHGASGRNGGWLMGTLEGLSRYACDDGRLTDATREILRQLIPDFAKTLETLAIDCELNLAGAIYAAAHYPEQAHRARDYLEAHHRLGFDDTDFRWLSADAVMERVQLPAVSGGVFTPHVATLHPGLLIKGLVSAARQLGVQLYSQTPATHWAYGKIHTTNGELTYQQLLLATEGYGEALRPRHLLPVQSGMVATAPLSAQVWEEIGLAGREALCDFSRGSTYLQRTRDGRLIVGARGHYRYGGNCQHAFGLSSRDRAMRIAMARDWFPILRDVAFPYAWGGSLAVPRDYAPALIVNRDAAVITAGGYLGEGVGASFLFGRTAAELMHGHSTAGTSMPWVRESTVAPRRWETEPLPTLGFHGLMALYRIEEWAHTRSMPKIVRNATSSLCDRTEALMGL